MTEDEVMEALARYPSYEEAEREMPAHLRLHAIQNALQFFAPLPVHIDLEQRFSRMIRAGYQMRNPTARGFWRDLDDKSRSLAPSTSVVPNCARSLTLGFTIIGFPGVGKSTSVEAVLSLYPQVIYHGRYGGREFNVAQVVWLKLECPHDGSIRGMCLNFFQAIDDLLGTNYEFNYGSGRRTTDELLPKMARVAAIHGVGVLVIDEVQRLSGAKSGGAGKMLNFFVQLTNSIGVPVVLVGTFKAKSVLSGEFHQIRRGTGQGDLVWDRMEEGEWVEGKKDGEGNGEEGGAGQKPGVWQLFLESLWPYQYVKVPCALTKELSHVLYEETQGITDFAAKVYMLAQVRAITTAAAPCEEGLTEDVIR
ncbi:MAG: ATP-binding protein, partial [Acidobacteria bacterium]|nr:ATP-binding protein [Acidobacteriota bacterium]